MIISTFRLPSSFLPNPEVDIDQSQNDSNYLHITSSSPPSPEEEMVDEILCSPNKDKYLDSLVSLSVVGVRAQARLLLGRLEVIGPGAGAAAGRRNHALNLEKIWANQRRADQLCRLQGKALLRRGHFKID